MEEATTDPCSFFGAEEAARLDQLCGGLLSHPDSGTYELGWDYGEVFNITPHSVGVMCIRFVQAPILADPGIWMSSVMGCKSRDTPLHSRLCLSIPMAVLQQRCRNVQCMPHCSSKPCAGLGTSQSPTREIKSLWT